MLFKLQVRGWNFLSPLTNPGLFGDDFLLAWQIEVLAQPWRKFLCSLRQFQRLTLDLGEACCRRLLKWSLTFVLLVFCIFLGYSCFVITVRSFRFPFVTCWLEKVCQSLLTHDQLIATFNIFECNYYLMEV